MCKKTRSDLHGARIFWRFCTFLFALVVDDFAFRCYNLFINFL